MHKICITKLNSTAKFDQEKGVTRILRFWTWIETIDLVLAPPAEDVYASLAGAETMVLSHTIHEEYTLSRSRLKNCRAGETRKIWLVCAHAGQYKNRRGYLTEGSRKRRSSTRSLKCPFTVTIKRDTVKNNNSSAYYLFQQLCFCGSLSVVCGCRKRRAQPRRSNICLCLSRRAENWSSKRHDDRCHGKSMCCTQGRLGDSPSKRSKQQFHSKNHIQCKSDGPGRTSCWKNTNGNAAGWASGKQHFTCLRPQRSRSNNQAFLCTKLMRPTCKRISQCHDHGLYIQGQ